VNKPLSFFKKEGSAIPENFEGELELYQAQKYYSISYKNQGLETLFNVFSFYSVYKGNNYSYNAQKQKRCPE
jgi:hypothetical protein